MRSKFNDVPRLVIAGVTSGAGKTSIATSIMFLLKEKGLRVQSFKVGPDFIDPTYHTLVTGRQSRNLDVWMMREKGVIECFNQATIDADIAVIEGVMGLFDGLSGRTDFASTAHIARILDAPVILVIDSSKAARSIAAVALGFLQFDKRLKIAGIILNNIAGDRHASYILEAFSGRIKVPIVGIVKRNSEIRLEERHLGLVPAPELDPHRKKAISKAVKAIAEQIDIQKIDRLWNVKLRARIDRNSYKSKETKSAKNAPGVAVALDESFNFYYADNLDSLRKQNLNLVFFSPVHDNKIPDNSSGVILGGGFPEVLADRLENNWKMKKSIVDAANEGMPIYAECGGLMYLTRSINGYRGESKPKKMIGLVDADTAMTGRLTLNYTEADCNGPIFGNLAKIRGHEFHYSEIKDISKDSRFAYSLRRGNGVAAGKDGFIVGKNVLASYMHVHFADSRLPRHLASACIAYSRR